jgi:hypothetical protein
MQGINVIGYISGGMGMGLTARNVVASLQQAGAPTDFGGKVGGKLRESRLIGRAIRLGQRNERLPLSFDEVQTAVFDHVSSADDMAILAVK